MFLLAAALGFSLQNDPVSPAPVSTWEREVVYQIFPRSFRDSNGDRNGDLKGIAQSLGHLKRLGVTAILLNPVAKSRTYHNYFADDFLTCDPELGTNAEFFDLVRQAHRNRLKVILDIEPQYVTEAHPWFGLPGYTWNNPGPFTTGILPLFDGQPVRARAIDPESPGVRAGMGAMLRHWALPAGRPADGVDGFRIDHMMDDFDFQHVKTRMLSSFWRPLISDLRREKPQIFFVGEQADWGFGQDLFDQGGVDANFALPLFGALSTLDPENVRKVIALTSTAIPAGKTTMVFVEIHDTMRWASRVGLDLRLVELGAVLNLSLKGTPLTYYGQELGMRGKQDSGRTDANDIPVRLAYRWSRRLSARGTATWYPASGSWTEMGYSADDDGISVEEQQRRPNSIFNLYRKLIRLRQRITALREGTQTVLNLDSPKVLGILRHGRDSEVLVLANFSPSPVVCSVPTSTRMKVLHGLGRLPHKGKVEMPAYGVQLIELKGKRTGPG